MAERHRSFREQVRRAVLPLTADARWVWVESTILTVLALGLAYAVQPEQPFFVESEFPWPWFAPLLLALRYGMMPGIFSAFLMLAAWLLLNYWWLPQAGEFPKLYFFGGMLAVMVCGEYSDLWQTRLRRLNEANHFLDERMSRMTKLHHLLRLSHDRLEQDLLSRPATLRDTLVSLRGLAVGDRRGQAMPAGEDMLVLLAQYCQLEGAALYATDDDGRSFSQVAKLGDPPAFDRTDPMVDQALEHRTLTHVQTMELSTATESRFLVVAPVLSSKGRLLGVLAVDQMPFFALNQDTLQLLAVMLGYYADSVSDVEEVREITERHADCPLEFAEELVRLWRLGRDHGVQSHVVSLSFLPHDDREDMVMLLKRMKRGLDVAWELRRGETVKYVNLMPLCGEVAVEGYLQRLEHLFKQHFGVSLEDACGRVHVAELGVKPLMTTMEDIVTHA
ncbi:MAG: PelD GGDEF domain-containing protein [Sulfuricellaceae bacterium]|jgi:hypothetical protein